MSKEAMKLALEALEIVKIHFTQNRHVNEAITALQEALAEQPAQQEPVAYLCENAVGHKYFRWKKPSSTYKPIALYTSPQAQQALNKKAENARELGLDYEPAPVAKPHEQEPVLQDIEQYRLQMAGISTAAIGYWKEGDGIHPDYDTVALRDVAKLYAKYDALYKAQPAQQEPVAFLVDGDLYYPEEIDWETLQEQGHTVAPLYTSPPAQRTWVGLTDEEKRQIFEREDYQGWLDYINAIEAKLKEKNT